MIRDRALDYDGVCRGCVGTEFCAGGHGPCIEAARGENDSRRSGIISPRDHSLPDWLCDLGGTFEFDYSPSRHVIPLLPGYVPVIERQARGIVMPSWPSYGLHLHTVLTPARLQLTSAASGLRDYFRVPGSTKMVLMCYARDSMMEELWARRDTDRVVGRLAEAGLDLIVSPNFSVYDDQPRMTHLVRMRMAHIFFREMMEAGLPVVPHVYFGAAEDIARWGDWIGEHPEISLVACNIQTATDPVYFGRMLRGLAEIRSRSGRRFSYMVSGPSSPPRLRQTFTLLGADTIVTNAVPHQTAAKRHVIEIDGVRRYCDLPYPALLEASIQAMSHRIEAARSMVVQTGGVERPGRHMNELAPAIRAEALELAYDPH